MPITLSFASLFALFALILSFRAGAARGKTGISILYGDPPNLELAERVRAHQNLLEYVPMILIVMGAIELSGGSRMFLGVSGGVLLVARLAHAIGLKHGNMMHKGRLIGAGGTVIVTLAMAGYGLWIGGPAMLG